MNAGEGPEQSQDTWEHGLPTCARGFALWWLAWLGMIAAFVYPAVVLVGVGYHENEHLSLRFVHAAYRRKEAIARRLADRPAGRIFLVGGSGTYWSCRADLVEAATGRGCINFGVHAGYGQEYTIRRSMRSMRAGDIFVHLNEYRLYERHPADPLTGRTWEMATTYDWRHFVEIGLVRTYRTLYSVPVTAFVHVPRTLRHILGFKEEQLTGDRLVELTSPRGDLLVNGAYSVPEISAAGDAAYAPPTEPDPDWARPLFAALPELQARGIRVLHSWPLIVPSPQLAEITGQLDRYMRDRLAPFGVPIIERPSDLFVPEGLITNTRFHSTMYGAVERTWHLLEHLPADVFLDATGSPVPDERGADSPLLLLSWASTDVAGSIAAWRAGARQARRPLPEPGRTALSTDWDAVVADVARGRRVLADDPALLPHLVERQLSLAAVVPTEPVAGFADLFAEHPQHLLLIAAHGTAPADRKVLAERLGTTVPPGTGVAAIVGTGEFAPLTRHAAGTEQVAVALDHRCRLVTGDELRLAFSVTATPRLGVALINNTIVSTSLPGPGIEVIVVDPATGTIAARNIYDGTGSQLRNRLYEVVPAAGAVGLVATPLSREALSVRGEAELAPGQDSTGVVLCQNGQLLVDLPTDLGPGDYWLDVEVHGESRAWVQPLAMAHDGPLVAQVGSPDLVPIFARPHRVIVPFTVPPGDRRTTPPTPSRVSLWLRALAELRFRVTGLRLHRATRSL